MVREGPCLTSDSPTFVPVLPLSPFDRSTRTKIRRAVSRDYIQDMPRSCVRQVQAARFSTRIEPHSADGPRAVIGRYGFSTGFGENGNLALNGAFGAELP